MGSSFFTIPGDRRPIWQEPQSPGKPRQRSQLQGLASRKKPGLRFSQCRQLWVGGLLSPAVMTSVTIVSSGSGQELRGGTSLFVATANCLPFSWLSPGSIRPVLSQREGWRAFPRQGPPALPSLSEKILSPPVTWEEQQTGHAPENAFLPTRHQKPRGQLPQKYLSSDAE